MQYFFADTDLLHSTESPAGVFDDTRLHTPGYDGGGLCETSPLSTAMF